MDIVEWADVSDYIGAGNLDKVVIGEDLDSLAINIVYLGGDGDTMLRKAEILIECHNCCYLDLRRSEMHTLGPSAILEAYLRTESELIDALRGHKLDSRTGCLCLEVDEKPVYHLEIIGEISMNVLCEDLTIKSSPVTCVESATS